MYEYGYELWTHTSGREDETEEAIYWITRAAEKGEPEAMFTRAMIASAGGEYNDSCPIAVHWFQKGAEAGDPNCMGKLAVAYRFGYLGLVKDEGKYRYWMDKAMAIDKERSKSWGR